MRGLKKRQKFVTTTDNFHPTFHDGTVEVCLIKDGKALWRVAVWGNDDYGLELNGLDCDEGFELYHSIEDGTTIKGLTSQGFKPA